MRLTENFSHWGSNLRALSSLGVIRTLALLNTKYMGQTFTMIEELSLHYAYAQQLQEVWKQCSSKGGNAEQYQSIHDAQRSPWKHCSPPKQDRLILSQMGSPASGATTLNSWKKKNINLLILQDSVLSPACFLQSIVESVASWLLMRCVQAVSARLPKRALKSSCLKARNLSAFCDLLEGFQLSASQGMQVLEQLLFPFFHEGFENPNYAALTNPVFSSTSVIPICRSPFVNLHMYYSWLAPLANLPVSLPALWLSNYFYSCLCPIPFYWFISLF